MADLRPLLEAPSVAQKEASLADVEIMARVERRRKVDGQEKAALLAEVEAEGGKVAVVAGAARYRRACCITGARVEDGCCVDTAPGPWSLFRSGVGRADDEGPAMLAASPHVPAPERSGAPA